MISQLIQETVGPDAKETRRREIAQNAYEKWRLNGEPQGRDFDFWLQAESEYDAGKCDAQREVLEIPIALIEEVPLAVAVWEPSGDVVYSNRRFHSLADGAHQEFLRQVFSALSESPESVSPQMKELPVSDSTAAARLRTWTFPVNEAEDGLLCTVFSEESDRAELQRSRDLLLQTCRLLSSSGTLQDFAATLLESICSAYGWDVGLFWRVNHPGTALVCRAVSTVWEEELKDFCLESFQTEFAAGVGLPGKVWSECRALSYPVLSTQSAHLYRKSKLKCGLTSAFLCPIRKQDRFLGVLEFYSLSSLEPTIGFQETIASVSTQVAQFILDKDAQLSLHRRERELQLAKRIQLNCQPQKSLKFAGCQVAGVSLAADSVGGDYFDFFPIGGDKILIAIGDAAGHGISSALRISEVRAYIRALAMAESSLERIFALTNQYFIDHSESGSFVTLLVVSLDPDTGVLKYNNAGHLSGYVFDPDGHCRLIMPSTSFPIGIAPCAKFPPGPSLQLHRGEWILLFSDGVIDARNKDGELLGNDGFLKFARLVGPGSNAQESARQMLNRVSEFADCPLEDDMTVVIISRDPV